MFIVFRQFSLIFGGGWVPRDSHRAKSEYPEHACDPGANCHRFVVSFGFISGDCFQTFRRLFRECLRSVFEDARKTCGYRFLGRFGCRFGIVFGAFWWPCESDIFVTRLVRKLYFRGSPCPDGVSNDFSAILGPWEALWRLWPQIFRVTFQGVERWGSYGPPPPGRDNRGSDVGLPLLDPPQRYNERIREGREWTLKGYQRKFKGKRFRKAVKEDRLKTVIRMTFTANI